MAEDIIIILDAGSQGFSDQKHLVNFTKYLFSQSSKHQPNNDTQKNFYMFGADMKNSPSFNFVTHPSVNMDMFMKQWRGAATVAQLKNSIDYPFFMMEVNGKLITNFVSREANNQIGVKIPQDMFDHIVEHYYNGDINLFNGAIMEKLSQYFTFTEFIHAEMADRLEVEKKIHSESISSREEGETVFITMSHNDQPDHSLYHIHSVYAQV